jgi:hypothetical protein
MELTFVLFWGREGVGLFLPKCVHFHGSSSPIVQPTGGVKSVTNKFPDSQRIFSENAELVLLTKPKIKDCTIHDEEPLSSEQVQTCHPT